MWIGPEISRACRGPESPHDHDHDHDHDHCHDPWCQTRERKLTSPRIDDRKPLAHNPFNYYVIAEIVIVTS